MRAGGTDVVVLISRYGMITSTLRMLQAMALVLWVALVGCALGLVVAPYLAAAALGTGLLCGALMVKDASRRTGDGAGNARI